MYPYNGNNIKYIVQVIQYNKIYSNYSSCKLHKQNHDYHSNALLVIKFFLRPPYLTAAGVNCNFVLLPGFFFTYSWPDWINRECGQSHCLHSCCEQFLLLIPVVTSTV